MKTLFLFISFVAFTFFVNSCSEDSTGNNPIQPVSNSLDTPRFLMMESASKSDDSLLPHNFYWNDTLKKNFRAEISGKIIVLNFWSIYCGFCMRELPELAELQEEYKSKNVRFVGVNLDDVSDPNINGLKGLETYVNNRFAESGYTFKMNYTNFVDTKAELFNLYGFQGIPSTVFIDKNGNIHKKVLGAVSKSYLKSILDPLISK